MRWPRRRVGEHLGELRAILGELRARRSKRFLGELFSDQSDAESDALTKEFASDALLASKLREIADGAVETILGSQREEGGLEDMLVCKEKS